MSWSPSQGMYMELLRLQGEEKVAGMRRGWDGPTLGMGPSLSFLPLFSHSFSSGSGRRVAPVVAGFVASERSPWVWLLKRFAGCLSQRRTPEGAPHRHPPPRPARVQAPGGRRGAGQVRLDALHPLPAEIASELQSEVAFALKSYHCLEW